MKSKDYFRLARINLKTRKKTTIHTILGLAFGFAFLVPVLYLAISTKVDLVSVANESPSYLTTYIDSSQTSESYDSHSTLLSNDDINGLINNKKHEQYIKSEIYEYKGSNKTNLKIDTKRIDINYYDNQVFDPNSRSFVNINHRIKVIDNTSSDNIVLSNYVKELNNQGEELFVAGKTFTKGVPGQVILSEDLACRFSRNYSSLIGKKLTIDIDNQYSSDDRYIIDDDNIPNNIIKEPAKINGGQIITDFEIVGIINKKYFRLADISIHEPSVWITYDSLFHNNKKIMPYTVIKEESIYGNDNQEFNTYITYTKDFDKLQKTAKENKKIFLAYPLVKNSKYSPFNLLKTIVPSYVYNVSFTKFSHFKPFYESVNEMACKQFEVDRIQYSYIDGHLNDLLYIDNTMDIFVIALSIVASIILFITILNSYNSLSYSVSIRNNYLGMMRAIGMHDKDIPKLFVTETAYMSLLSLPFVFITSISLSLAYYFFANEMLEIDESALTIEWHLNIYHYFYIFAGVVMFMFLLFLIICLIVTRKSAKSKILDVLNRDM